MSTHTRSLWTVLGLPLLGILCSPICVADTPREWPTQMLCHEYARSNQEILYKQELLRRGVFSRLEWEYIDRQIIEVGVRTEVLWCALGEPSTSERRAGKNTSDRIFAYTKSDGSELLVETHNGQVLSIHNFPSRKPERSPTSKSPTQAKVAYGTCFAVSESEVITSHHVIADSSLITVQFQDGTEIGATVAQKSQSIDVAVLKIIGAVPAILPLAPMRSIAIGDEVFTVGYPVTTILGSDPKFTEGSVSSLTGIQGDASYFQMSVPIQPGNSGGPVVNMRGEVIGIVAATAAVEAFYAVSGSLPQNVNWASKADYARLMFEPPNIDRRAKNRTEAIQMVGAAICRVKAVAQ